VLFRSLTALPDNEPGDFDYGWLGQHQRPLEHEGSLATIEMGARPYVPSLGRFLEVDPVEGGSCNDYDYTCGDPVNHSDLSGLCNSPEAWCIIGILTGFEDMPTVSINGSTFDAWLNHRGGTIDFRHTKAGNRAMRGEGGCSHVASKGGFFNFRNACRTHDLGYDLMRWFGSSGFLGSSRAGVDLLFLNDMRADCRARRYLVPLEGACNAVAGVYYGGVSGNSVRQGYGVP
jgi:RHS repeat-associated protein